MLSKANIAPQNGLEIKNLLRSGYCHLLLSKLFISEICSSFNPISNINRMEKMLAPVIKINKNKRLNQSALETLLVDATEIRIQRATKMSAITRAKGS